MDWIEIVGFVGTGLTFAAWGMRGAVALRAFGIASSVAFLSFGLLSETWPVVATELVLLPLNAFRLWQLLAERRERHAADAIPLPPAGGPGSAAEACRTVRRMAGARTIPAEAGGAHAKMRSGPERDRAEVSGARDLAA